jgi:hypothetical protein
MSAKDIDDTLLPKDVPRSDGAHGPGQQPRPRSCLCYVILAVLILVLIAGVGAITPAVSQMIIDGMELELGDIMLTDPSGETVRMQCSASMVLPRLPLPVSTGPLELAAALADEPDSPVGVFSLPQGLEMGMGGQVALTFAGKLTVTDSAAFRRLAARIIQSASLELRLASASPFELKAGPMTIPGMALSKVVALKGADGAPPHLAASVVWRGPAASPQLRPQARPESPARTLAQG